MSVGPLINFACALEINGMISCPSQNILVWNSSITEYSCCQCCLFPLFESLICLHVGRVSLVATVSWDYFGGLGFMFCNFSGFVRFVILFMNVDLNFLAHCNRHFNDVGGGETILFRHLLHDFTTYAL